MTVKVSMSTALIILLLLVVLFGGVGSFYSHKKAGWRGLSAALALVGLALVCLWLFVRVGAV